MAGVPTQDCSAAQAKTGSCPDLSVGNDGKEVTIGGTEEYSGKGAGGPHPPLSEEPSEPPPPYVLTVDRPGYTVTKPLTIADLARFKPAPGTDHMEPNHWMVVGLPTNFYAKASTHVKDGVLLNRPASVRFTPVRFTWTYGDGSTHSSYIAGSTWSAQGLHEFDATPTSHIYRTPGKYIIDLTIGFRAEYRYAGGTSWIPVSGLVWVPANRLEAEAAAGAKTVLVEDECTINPSGPGC